ncbi:MAG TPA: 4,5-DOPA dioxygenase extradiol [Gammaproteobacteria bacterium]|nr:4,5-DOPA dioxygenase extradiol [Gammaproteobacteria bacterium]
MAAPALFVGHGSPMNVLRDNAWTRAWSEVGSAISPRAVLCVSAHWYGPGIRITAMAEPRTIHDFGGFPEELYRIRYPAPGAPELAGRVRELLARTPVEADDEWGLDHGAWSVLWHMFPQANVPVAQLSLDSRLTPAQHCELARRLAPLRAEGVLVLGSGNLVHNLREYDWSGRAGRPAEWAARFEARILPLIEAVDVATLGDYASPGADARRAVPTPEHFLPLLYVLALAGTGDRVSFPACGFDGGTISMLSVRVGQGPVRTG